MAVRTRGSRISQTIASSAGVQGTATWRPSRRLARMPSVSPSGTATLPAATPRARTGTTEAIPATASHAARRARRRLSGCRTAIGSAGARVIVAGWLCWTGGDLGCGWCDRGSRRARDPGDHELRMDRLHEVDQALDQARTGSGDDDVIDREDLVVLDRGHRAPARPGRDLLGRDVWRVGRVAEQDDLGVGGDELLEGDVVGGGAAGRDRIPTGERDHLGQERLVGRGVDRR